MCNVLTVMDCFSLSSLSIFPSLCLFFSPMLSIIRNTPFWSVHASVIALYLVQSSRTTSWDFIVFCLIQEWKETFTFFLSIYVWTKYVYLSIVVAIYLSIYFDNVIFRRASTHECVVTRVVVWPVYHILYSSFLYCLAAVTLFLVLKS